MTWFSGENLIFQAGSLKKSLNKTTFTHPKGDGRLQAKGGFSGQ